jgi:phosphohistidine phosphatase
MLVGHLPHLSKLSACLLCGEDTRKILNFQMSGVVCLERDEEGNWSVQWMLIPQIL